MYTLLTADDEELERSAVRLFMTGANEKLGTIYEAANGREMLDQVHTHQPDILILDINMPGMSGLEALEKIRSEESPAKHLKVIISTAYNSFDYAVKALQLGAVDFLVKPVKKDVLISCIARTIEMIEEEKRNFNTSKKTLNNQSSDNVIHRHDHDTRAEQDWCTENHATAAQTEAVQKIIKYIEENYAKQIGLDDIALSCGCSKFHMTRFFKAQTNTTVVDYLIKYRISVSKQLLAATQHSIKEISSLAGYSDPNYFTWTFKKLEGISPLQYRHSVSST